jgi:hypothetical protein
MGRMLIRWVVECLLPEFTFNPICVTTCTPCLLVCNIIKKLLPLMDVTCVGCSGTLRFSVFLASCGADMLESREPSSHGSGVGSWGLGDLEDAGDEERCRD